MANDEDKSDDKSPDAINELKKVSERTSGAELIVWIDDFRAKQLLPQGQEKLQSVLTEIAMRILAEGRRIASADAEGDPFSRIGDHHIASGLIFVVEKLSSRVSKRRKLQLVAQNLAAATFGSAISLLVDKHFYLAVACIGFTAVVYCALYLRSEQY
jgi:hypothetical protein